MPEPAGARRVAGVLIEPALCRPLAGLLQLGLAQARRDGVPVPAAVREAVHAITVEGSAALLSPTRQDLPVPGSASDIGPRSDQRALSVRSAAGLLGVTERHVQRLAKSGELPGERIGSRTWSFTRTAVDEYRRAH